MAEATKNQRTRHRKNSEQINSAKFAEPRYSNNNAIESRNSIAENPNKMKMKKKKKFLVVKFKGLGCKGTSSPAIARPAATERAINHNQRIERARSKNRRNAENVAVDFPDVCCAPPGIGIASDFAPRARNITPRSDQRKHYRETRRNEDDFPSILRGVSGSTTDHQSAGEIIEMMMYQQPILSRRALRERDRYRGWRLNVDDMSYEELIDLSDKIGYVGTGLQQQEINSCLRKFKHFNSDYNSLSKDWKCSICQEKCKKDDDDIGTLNCGHHHHIQCINQWLRHRNACPVCKSAAINRHI